MHRFLTVIALALTALMLAGVAPVRAQYYQAYYPPTVIAPAPVVSYSYYAPPVYYAPSVSYYAPAPAVSYYAAPAVSYYAAPTVAYSPGVVTTRSFVGLGIFRPRGVYYQSYYTPGYYYP